MATIVSSSTASPSNNMGLMSCGKSVATGVRQWVRVAGLMPSRTVSGAIASVQKVSKPAWPSKGISSFLRISKGMPRAT